MLAKCYSCALAGIDGRLVEVEVKTGSGGEADVVSIVGLPDTSVRESRDRVRSAIQSSGFAAPEGATVINLAPADLRKEGGAFDLAMALGMLGCCGELPAERLRHLLVMGELALDGALRPVRGALVAAIEASKSNGEIKALLVPAANAGEAAFAAGTIPVYGLDTLAEVVQAVRTGRAAPCRKPPFGQSGGSACGGDFADVKGQVLARRAMEIAAAGGHNSLMIGPPGTGKSMIASRLPSILPPMTLEETLEISRVHSVLGLLAGDRPLLERRPFRAPHHTISDIGLIGGGRDIRPGEISLAHNGVLFLDELPEFKRSVLEVLRQPLENGTITISRASGCGVFPARFMLVAAMNPCPCGYGDAELGCRCKVDEKRRYRKKISGPLLDRIDLHVPVRQLSEEELLAAPSGESSARILERVLAARAIQSARFRGLRGIHCNAHMGSREINTFCAVSPACRTLLAQAIRKFRMSPRAYDRMLKVARTIADLAGSCDIGEDHLFEAVNYRSAFADE